MSKIPITIELLQGTGAGKIMRVMAKKPGNIGSKASSVLNKWRDVVANSQKSSDPSSLKENDHPKAMLHHSSSKSHHKSEKETKKSEKHNEEKYLKKEKHSKDLHSENRHSNSEHSKEKLKMLSKEEKHYKEKHSTKRPSNEELEHELKKKHAKEKDMKINYKVEHSKHSIKHNGESHSSKKNTNKNKLSSPSKSEKISSKHSSSFLQKNLYDEDDDSDSEYANAFSNNEQEVPASNNFENAHNSDSSSSFESSPKKSRTSETDSYKPSSESRTHSNKDLKSSSDFEKLSKKKLVKDGESSKKSSSSERAKEERTNNKSKTKKTVKKSLKMLSTEEFTSSEATFEDCLSFNDIVPLKKKKNSKLVSSSLSKKVKEISKDIEHSSKVKNSKDSYSSPIPSEKEKNDLKVPEETAVKYTSPEKCVDIASTLPQTQPNYRPLPQRNYDFSPIKKRENMSNEDAIKFTSSRKEKTAVYSGRKNKSNYLTAVPTLFECCTRVLIENIDDIEYMGEIPYFLLESMLQRCTPSQLYRIEDFNPYLLEDTNELWEVHCKRDYRTAKPQENETWRELYWRSHDEREQRLRSVTANISALIANSNPTRKAKLAYVDSVVKPPRDVARRQAKHGTALPTNHTVKAGPATKDCPRPTAPSINSANSAASTSRPRAEAKPMKPKIAPLMAKTLKSMKKCFRR
ncbi:transcription elongation factor B polypeptide 3 isoform X2 [Parasteatoda tepidariorum]|nr:transcription elongation factor B polypeptide 3 isoform X2 [Parasteatoda tepidariorum]